MPFSNFPLPFDNIDLTAMRSAYYGASRELGIGTKSAADRDRRERLAALIVELAQLGERNAADLQRRALRLLKSQVEP